MKHQLGEGYFLWNFVGRASDEQGAALRRLPIKNTTDTALVNNTAMYNQLIHQCQWRGLDNPQVYYDENDRGFVTNYRLVFNTLAKAPLQEGKAAQVQEVLLRCLEVMPDRVAPYDAANACRWAFYSLQARTQGRWTWPIPCAKRPRSCWPTRRKKDYTPHTRPKSS